MQVMTLFDAQGKIHALFQPSTEPGAPAFRFHPAAGHRAALLDVPAELQNMKLAQLHAALRVDVSQAHPRLLAQAAK